MNAIDQYQQQKRRLELFEAWASLIGKEYFGGTRGQGGKYGEVTGATGSLTIYHQAYDGANNYHDLDKDFTGELATAMKANAALLIESVRSSLKYQLERAKVDARKLSEELKP